MSRRFTWQPVAAQQERSLDLPVVYAIAAALQCEPGDLNGQNLGRIHSPLLQAIRTLCNDDAKEDIDALLEAIDHNGAVVLWIEY